MLELFLIGVILILAFVANDSLSPLRLVVTVKRSIQIGPNFLNNFDNLCKFCIIFRSEKCWKVKRERWKYCSSNAGDWKHGCVAWGNSNNVANQDWGVTGNPEKPKNFNTQKIKDTKISKTVSKSFERRKTFCVKNSKTYKISKLIIFLIFTYQFLFFNTVKILPPNRSQKILLQKRNFIHQAGSF